MKTLLFSITFIFSAVVGFAQQASSDTIFRAGANAAEINNKTNPFIGYAGKIIRHIKIKNVGFEGDIKDTTKINSGFGVTFGNALHKNTINQVIANNLLFKEGETLNPYLLSDNERYLRDLDYIQDALIIIQKTNEPGYVDLLVLVKDGFSIVPGAGVGGAKKYKLELKEQNLGGSGAMIAASSLFDNARKPKFGFGADFLQRNIRGSFINWGFGFKNYNNAFNSNRNEETVYYLRFEKPLVSQYLRWFGAIDLSYNKTSNVYNDSAYKKNYRYSFYNIDGWIAYNIGSGKLRRKNTNRKIRNLVALRAFHQHFNDIPDEVAPDINKNAYANSMGVLGSFSVFKQNFYRTNYIYGFGRNEDIPQGFNASIVGGYVKRTNVITSKTRPYLGIEFSGGKYSKKEFYSFYNVRIGGFQSNNKWEDVEVLLSGDHFTRLHQINPKWHRRFFFSGSFAKQFSNLLNQPLQLISVYGLPYFNIPKDSADLRPAGDLRMTSKTEIVFYSTKKHWGFGFAPFGFVDLCLLKPFNVGLGKSDVYSAVGTGFRIRNENLLFGTIEARFSYFPRVIPGMQHVKVKFNTNLRYKYNNSLVRRPDFVAPN